MSQFVAVGYAMCLAIFEEILKKCGLATLAKRRSRGDFIEAYKIT